MGVGLQDFSREPCAKKGLAVREHLIARMWCPALLLLAAAPMAVTLRVGGVGPAPASLLQPRRALRCAAPACSAADGSSDSAVLLASLKRVSACRGDIVVVKFGGHAMTNNQASFAADMVLLQSLGLLPVVVHGGGPQINKMLDKLEIQSTFVNGLRVTTPAVMEVVEMVLCGQLNKQIASAINAAGGRAVGISGKDDAMVTGSIKNPELGLVGEAEHVKTSLLHMLLEEGIIPVIAPVATGEGGTSLNLNADTMAGEIAGALRAKQLLLLTDVAGVLDGNKQLIPTLTTAAAQQLCVDGTATGGMIPKIENAISAVRAGTSTAVIMDGRVEHCSVLHLFGGGGVGTAVSD